MESEFLTDRADSHINFEMDLVAATLAHEIRNPLQAMRLQIESAIRGASSSDAIVQISRNLDRIERVVNKVQSLSQKYKLKLETVNLQELVERAISGSRVWLQAAGIEVHIQTQWEGQAFCELDGDLVEQVILNIVTNAMQAMPKGGHLWIRIFECDHRAHIQIEDTGVGMDAQTLKQIGTPFFTTKNSGNGLGVAFCRTIVSLHGGSFEVESTEGSGTSVSIYLPKSKQLR